MPYSEDAGDHLQKKRSHSLGPSCASMKSNQSMGIPIVFADEDFERRVRDKLSAVRLDFSKPIYSANRRHSALKITPQTKQVIQNFKFDMRKKFLSIHEGITAHGNSTFLNKIYTRLFITEGENGHAYNEHEMRQFEKVFQKPEKQGKSIKYTDVFKALSGQDKPIRTVLTNGIAGIGKTVFVYKFILDWAEGKANQDIHFIFPLPFRELNLIKKKNLSVISLLHLFFPTTKKIKLRDYDRYKILFIFDGLDEYRFPLDFRNNEILSDVTKTAPTDVLLTNLIKGKILPSAHIWITSQPAAAIQIPFECIDYITEVRGFSDPQKEEYFRKRISDQNLATKVITHIKSLRSIHIMCHIPVFSWIAATVLETLLRETESKMIPKTLTEMFTHFLILQTKHRSQKYHEMDPHQFQQHILALGKLAFQQLEKGNLVFYEEDLRECGIDVREASVYSGVCMLIFREEIGLYMGKVYSFVHLSVQEHLAAVYVLLSFINKNISEQQTVLPFGNSNKTTFDFFKNAVDWALQSKNGHLDLFLRFLLGLSLTSNQALLQDVLKQTRSISSCKKEIIEYIKKKIRDNPSAEKAINMSHCLDELNDE